jgi:tryptophanase
MSNHFTRFSTSGTVDAEYRFGRPKVYLALHELVRLTILRSKLGDTHAERVARAASGHAATQLFPPSRRSLR